MRIKRLWNFYSNIYMEGEGNGMAPGAGEGILTGNPPTNVTPSNNGSPTTPPTNGSPTPPTTPWYGQNFQNQDMIQLLQQKGWHDAPNVEEGVNRVLVGYKNLETILGQKAHAIVKPDEKADENAWNDYYSKLRGDVNSGKDYGLQVSEDMKDSVDQPLLDMMQDTFHKSGLDKRQATNIFNAYNEYVSASNKNFNETFVTQSNNDIKELQTEYGNKFDDNMELSRRAYRFAAEKAGLDQKQLQKLEVALGTKAMLKMFGAFGAGFQEATSPPGNGGGFTSTPEYAKSKIGELKASPEFQGRYHSEDPNIRLAAIDEMEKWHKQAYGSEPVR